MSVKLAFQIDVSWTYDRYGNRIEEEVYPLPAAIFRMRGQ